MSQQVETFNLDRHLSIDNNVDALGKKWEIVRAGRESALLKAVPKPFRENFVCPKELYGMWTSAEKLQEKITLYLNKSWDMAEAATQKAERTVQVAKEAPKKQTPEESLKTLPAEVKDVLGEVIAVEKPKAKSKSQAKRVKAQSATKTGG